MLQVGKDKRRGDVFLVEHQFGSSVFIEVAELCVTDSKYTTAHVFEVMNGCVKKCGFDVFGCFGGAQQGQHKPGATLAR